MPDTHHAFEHVKAVYLPIAIVVFTLVVGAVLILLVRGAGRDRPGRRSNALRLELANAAVLACMAAFLVVITFRTETPLDHTVAHPALRVRVIAAQWSWRFEYPGGVAVAAVSTWHPRPALVPTGVEIEFAGISRDVIHGFWVPQLSFMRQLLPGHVSRFDLIFHAPGTYMGTCSVFCGEQHTEMHFALQAVPAVQFERWLASGGSSA
jgi:cytochrome c oxidase subunit II